MTSQPSGYLLNTSFFIISGSFEGGPGGERRGVKAKAYDAEFLLDSSLYPTKTDHFLSINLVFTYLVPPHHPLPSPPIFLSAHLQIISEIKMGRFFFFFWF